MGLDIFTERLAHVPTGPGVYLMRDKNNRILYVGKASNLRNRLRSYFVPTHHEDLKTSVLVSEIEDFEFIKIVIGSWAIINSPFEFLTMTVRLVIASASP